MNLREKIQQAAFWGGSICPKCGQVEEDEGQESCSECGAETVKAGAALGIVELLDRENE